MRYGLSWMLTDVSYIQFECEYGYAMHQQDHDMTSFNLQANAPANSRTAGNRFFFAFLGHC